MSNNHSYTDVVKEETAQQEKKYVDPHFGPSQKLWSQQVPEIAKSTNSSKYPNGYIIEPPLENPLEIYNQRSSNYPLQQEVMSEEHAQIPPQGQGSDRTDSLEVMQKYYETQRDKFIGYQCVEQFKISHDMAPFLDMSLNNLGDPFQNGYFTVNAKQAERNVLDFFASLWHAQWPSLPKPKMESANHQEYLQSEAYTKYKNSYWGYILSMGSTEGNLYAVLSARDYLSGYSLVVDEVKEESLCPPNINTNENPNKYTPVAFYSEAAHYSLAKAVHAMQVKTFAQIAFEQNLQGAGWECPLNGDWPESVPVDEYGQVIIDDLLTLVDFFAEKGYAPFICFNYGTTFKGAYDNVLEACIKLKQIFKKYELDDREVQYFDAQGNLNTDRRRGYWIHVDGAMGASLMPFVEMAVEHNELEEKDLASCFDFRIEEVMSIVTSGHKWPSASAPTGVYMTKNKYLITPVATPDYLGSADTTFAGSRNGMSAMILWNLLAKEGIAGMVDKAKKTINLCNYAEEQFEELQAKLKQEGLDIWLNRAPNGGTSLIFRKPVDEIMFRYSLPIEVEITKTEQQTIKRTYVHLFVFWDRNKNMLDDLIKDLSSVNAFDKNAEEIIESKERTKVQKNANQSSIKLLKRTTYKGFR